MISGIILASGFSRRMQQEKLLMKIDELPMVERVMIAAKSSRLEEVILVCRNPAIKALGEKHGIKSVYNSNAHVGQSAAVKSGIMAANTNSRAFLFIVGDQPLLNPQAINKLIEVYEGGGNLIVVPTYKGKNSSPVLFDAALKEELLAIEGDQGGRIIIEVKKDKAAFVEMDSLAVLEDIDSIESYLEFLEAFSLKAHK